MSEPPDPWGPWPMLALVFAVVLVFVFFWSVFG